ncbi:MAG: gfo/Idh/MocA family oxidoreductase [Acidobacteria bacterium]|nr:MAG: gfo/Idh/MocA family oxidoreductase [Acidobacteriota bacterium]REK01612.1 MAG: gfo/Idh/MocA family oxidoreductase [Acidobacteriota bacterium]REK14568.1 MAG: gfo/Idh/MocA family oxidoreductase [Acidobacteriota bacterium]REK45283.1 MAG: gfo/Idh/MocA family oxidoreductase [Acidobacteriota bacterium]
MSKVRIGIIGTGYIGNVHGRIYTGDERAEIGALFDIVPERAEAAARKIGGKVCSSREELFDHCDAVLVCTPNKTHVEIAKDAVAHGKHVFCEKPFAIGLEAAQELLDSALSSENVFQVGHNRRYAPVYAKLKELLGEDRAHSAHIKMNRGELKNPEWTGDVNVTGGFLYETTIHLFDMMRFQFGEIEELVAYGSQHEYPELDEFSVIFKFRNGFHCTFASSSDASWIFPFERIEVFCHHRTILTQEMEHLIDSQGWDANFDTHSWAMTEKEERWGYVQEDLAFIDAIIEGKEPPVTALDGYKSVELVESVYEAIKTGKRVRFD